MEVIRVIESQGGEELQGSGLESDLLADATLSLACAGGLFTPNPSHRLEPLYALSALWRIRGYIILLSEYTVFCSAMKPLLDGYK